MAGALAPVVIDANVAIAVAIPLPYSDEARARIAGWQDSRTGIYVPMLWTYEVVSALRKAVHARMLTQSKAIASLDLLYTIGVRQVEPDLELHRDALRWASRLGQVVAYDAQYLALAARLGADLWTADQHLVARAHEIGAVWVRHIAV